ncbi:dTMP kinase [Euzebya tangerina]|uniref:dTMP kinase n=1 Tax=Euzebya tangerina TaxID=591198 RepID=UPI000E313CCD|nr:dTMP kinase [Euzebya tangerina]
MPSDPASFIRRKGPNAPARVASSGRSAYFELLRNRNFRFWFASSFTSSVGDWMGFVALTALMTQLFENSSSQLFAVGGLLMIRLLPSAMFGPIAGVIADRYDRRKVLVFTDMARAVVYFMIVFAGDVLAIFALTFIVECISLLFLAAKDASLPQVVPDKEHLTEANQLNLLCSYGTLPLGAVSTSIMIAVAGVVGGFVSFEVDPLRLALLLDSISFVLSGLLLFQVTLPGEAERRQRREDAAEDGPGILDELREGLDFIRGFPLLRALITGIVGVFFGAGVVIGLGPVFMVSDLGQPSANWSILLSAVGGGLVVGIAVLIPVFRRFVQEEVFPIMLASVGILAVATALSVNFTMALVIGSLLGAAAGVAVVQGYTLLQSYTEDATRARTFSLFYVLTRISLFAALGISPFVAGAIGSIGVATGLGVVSVSGTRLTLVVGGLIGLYFGLRTRTAIKQAMTREDSPLKIGGAVIESDPALAEGLFISFEGGEGAGKSTQIRKLAAALEDEGRDVVVTREPGGAPLAERIRELVLDPLTTDMNDRTEALLIAAARADHVESTIRPALEEGKVVLCDRFIDSSLAYQGHARGLGVDDVGEVNRWAIDGVAPDVVVLLRLDPEEGMARVERRAAERAAEEAEERGGNVVPFREQGIDRLERAGREFHREVAKGYLKLARSGGERWLVVDATADADVVHAQVRAGLHRWLPLPDEPAVAVAPEDEPDVTAEDVAASDADAG